MRSNLGPTLEDVVRLDEKLRNTRKYLCMMLEESFGTIPEPVLDQISACQDANRLETWFRQAARIRTLEELRLE